MSKYESSHSSGVALVEEPSVVQNEQSFVDLKMDNIPAEDFISAVEDEVLSGERNKNNLNVAYLEGYLKIIKDKKENFLVKIGNEKRRLLAKSFFEIEEMIVKGLIEDATGVRSKDFKIEDAEWQQGIISFINKNKDNREYLKRFWAEYDSIFDYEENEESGNKYKAGIMAPLALQDLLQEKYGFKITYSKPKEDVECSVDMIAVDEQSKKFFLIQVKTDKKLIEKIIKKDLRGKSDKGNHKNEKELIKVVPRFEFGNESEETSEDYLNFSKGCLRYVENNKSLFQGKEYEVKGIYIYVPCVIGGEKLIDINGAPSYKLWEILVAEHLETKLDLPKKFDYAKVLLK